MAQRSRLLRALSAFSWAAVSLAALSLSVAACASTPASNSAELTSGPISIWYSTNEQEVAWAEAVETKSTATAAIACFQCFTDI